MYQAKLPTVYQNFIHLTRYARFNPQLGRRETWAETVTRTTNFLFKDHPIKKEIGSKILRSEVMPSMRVMMTAGPALEKENICAYNCSYIPLDSPKAFSEILYILMCGTGVGFSCETKYINRLPLLAKKFVSVNEVIIIEDSREGWAIGFRKYLDGLFKGIIYQVDYSQIRPAGAPLLTMGGRANGPEPLRKLFNFALNLFIHNPKLRLSSTECHELACMIGQCIVTGGVRRSAMISLMELNDLESRELKNGEWYKIKPYLSMANNSAVYNSIPSRDKFYEEWNNLRYSGSGERGIFHRRAAQAQAAKWSKRGKDVDYGINPCSEIILRPREFCNLTEVVIRPDDTLETLTKKVTAAAIIGTVQSNLTKFNTQIVDPIWKKNCEEERLLGVSLTGIMDHPVMRTPSDRLVHWLVHLRKVAEEANRVWSHTLGIAPSAALTCVKPSGTVSQLVDSSSGIHPRYSNFYFRRVRLDPHDPIIKFLQSGYKVVEVEYGPWDAKKVTLRIGSMSYHLDKSDHKDVVTEFLSSLPGLKMEIDRNTGERILMFPIKAPKSYTREDVTAMDQLELWKLYDQYWCDHKPSISVYVREAEWDGVGNWVYNHFNQISGLSFFPYDGGLYEQAPYTPVSRETYNREIANMPQIDWSGLAKFETGDSGANFEFACTSGKCEL